MKTSQSTPPVQPIHLNKIVAPEDPRDKKSFKRDVEGLKNEFKDHGQLVAVILTHCEGAQVFNLVAGSRRFEAAKQLGWKEIKAIVVPIEADADDETIRDWVRFIEQHQRYELDHYALAKAAIHMEEKWKVKGSEFARQLGLSNGYIYNLMRWYRHIPDKVREAWRAGSNLISQAELERYSHMSKEDALGAWEIRCRMRAAGSEPFNPNEKKSRKVSHSVTNGDGSKTKSRRASERQILMLQKAVDEAPLIGPVKQVISNVLRFVLGTEKHVHGLTDFHALLPPEIVSKEALKAQKKEAKNNAREQHTS